jgi:3-isopropylmalate/(R)-2-methylmalate dehydratase small subunit
MAARDMKGEAVASASVVLKLGDDISTDAIYPGRFMATVLPSETPQYAFADLPEFNSRLRARQIPQGSIVVAGSNFGCGSSREQAASALKGHGLVVIARSFGRIFLQNAVNLGLEILACPTIDASEGDELKISVDRIFNPRTNKAYDLQPLPAARQAIIDAGGLIPFARNRIMKSQTAKSRE